MVCLSCETMELIEGPVIHSDAAHQIRKHIQAFWKSLWCDTRYVPACRSQHRGHAIRPRASDRQAAHVLGGNLNYHHPPDAQTTRGYAPASSSCFSNFSLRAQASAGALSLVKSRSENCKPDYHVNVR
jgi:hypothetical protein